MDSENKTFMSTKTVLCCIFFNRAIRYVFFSISNLFFVNIVRTQVWSMNNYATKIVVCLINHIEDELKCEGAGFEPGSNRVYRIVFTPAMTAPHLYYCPESSGHHFT